MSKLPTLQERAQLNFAATMFARMDAQSAKEAKNRSELFFREYSATR